MTSVPNRESVFDKFKSILEVIAAIATIGAIAFAIQQYRAAKEDGRVNATLGYIGRFNVDPEIESFKRLYTAWQQGELASSDNPTQAQIKFIETNTLQWDVILLGDFFDQLYVCVLRAICDENLAISMLGRDIETTYVLSGRYLAENLPYTGCGLKALFDVVHPRLKYERLAPKEKEQTSSPRPKLVANACPSI